MHNNNSQRRKRRFGRKRIVWLIVVLLLISGAAFAAKSISQPVHGQEQHLGLKLAKPRVVPKVLPASSLENSYMTLALPVGYHVQETTQTASTFLYQRTILKPSSFGSTIIVITIKNMPEGGITADPIYAARASQPARYVFTKQVVGTDTLSIANDTTAAAVVAFWPHANYDVTISVGSGSEDAPVDNNADKLAILKTITSGWQWR